MIFKVGNCVKHEKSERAEMLTRMNKLLAMGTVVIVLGVPLDKGQYKITLQSWTSTLTGVLSH